MTTWAHHRVVRCHANPVIRFYWAPPKSSGEAAVRSHPLRYSEGTIVAPTAANAEALWFPVLNLVSLSNTEIMARESGEQLVEVCPLVLSDLQNCFVHGSRKRSA